MNNLTCTIQGERNSGTTFLTLLLKINGIDVFDGAEYNRLCFFWKHASPRDYLKLINERVVNIFIIRSLDEWLISMFYSGHSLAIPTALNFKEFLTYENLPSDYKCRGIEKTPYLPNGKVVNHTDFRKTVFEIRYEKIKSYLTYKAGHRDIVFVKLDYIRDKDNCYHFLNEMNKKYGLGITNIIPEITFNCKTGEPGNKKREYDIIIDEETRNLINRFKNDMVEEWVDNLTFEMS